MLEDMTKKRGTKEIEIFGEVKNFGTEEEPMRNDLRFSFSPILSRLIVEAGKTCKNYSSDLFISWESFVSDIQKYDGKDKETFTYYFGFRDLGVDHEAFIQTRLQYPESYGEKPYKSIFRLIAQIDPQNESIKMTLIQIFYNP